MAAASRGRSVALLELVEAQRQYDAALAGLALQRQRAGGRAEGHPFALEPERSILRARRSALVAARAFGRAYDAMEIAHVQFERTLEILAQARRHADGVGGAAEALARAERIVADGRARLLAAGEALGRARAAP